MKKVIVSITVTLLLGVFVSMGMGGVKLPYNLLNMLLNEDHTWNGTQTFKSINWADTTSYTHQFSTFSDTTAQYADISVSGNNTVVAYFEVWIPDPLSSITSYELWKLRRFTTDDQTDRDRYGNPFSFSLLLSYLSNAVGVSGTTLPLADTTGLVKDGKLRLTGGTDETVTITDNPWIHGGQSGVTITALQYYHGVNTSVSSIYGSYSTWRVTDDDASRELHFGLEPTATPYSDVSPYMTIYRY